MSVGCFGYSDIDRWLSSNLDRHFEDQDPGSRLLTFKMLKGKKQIKEWSVEISNEEPCYYEMHNALVKIFTKEIRIYLAELTEGPSLFNTPRKGPHTFVNPETMTNYYGTINKFAQNEIVEKWARLPKEFCIANKQFNLVRMGKYSVVCIDTLEENS